MTKYEPREYWSQLLESHYSVRGTAYAHLPRRLNHYLYRTQRDSVRRLLRDRRLRPTRVLDIGFGTGEWLRFWMKQGVRELVGLDLTRHAVEEGLKRFPGVELLQADISADGAIPQGFDVVSAMSVLLHVTEEERFEQALRNIRTALLPEGRLIVIDPIVVHHRWGPPFDDRANSRARSLDQWREALGRAGFELEILRPATSVLANPADTRFELSYRALELYWSTLGRIVDNSEVRGALVGAPLSALDRVLTRLLPNGPSTKLLLARAA